jgi:diacylglycerol kinase (ATP)
MPRIIKAFFYSLQGLKSCFQSEAAFREEVYATILILPFLYFIELDIFYKIYMLTTWFIVPIVELLNSAIETTVNRISTEIHPLSGKAKDIGSAAVLIALIHFAIVWSVILVNNFL